MWQRDGINLIYQRSFHKLHQRIIKANNIIPQYNEIVSQFSNRLDHSSSLSRSHSLSSFPAHQNQSHRKCARCTSKCQRALIDYLFNSLIVNFRLRKVCRHNSNRSLIASYTTFNFFKTTESLALPSFVFTIIIFRAMREQLSQQSHTFCWESVNKNRETCGSINTVIAIHKHRALYKQLKYGSECQVKIHERS